MKNIITITLAILLAISLVFNLFLILRLQDNQNKPMINNGPTQLNGTEEAITKNEPELQTDDGNSLKEQCKSATSICVYKDYNISGAPMPLEALYQIYYGEGENRAHFLYRPQEHGVLSMKQTSGDFSLDIFNEILDMICSTELSEYTYAVDQNGLVIEHVVPYVLILGDSQGYFLMNPIVLQGPDNLDEILNRFEKLVVDAGGITTSDSGFKDYYNLTRADGSGATFPLKAGTDGSQHYAIVSSITLYLDKNDEDYLKMGHEEKLLSESAALFAVTGNVLSTHTREEVNSNLDAIKQELLNRYQRYYGGSRFITGVELNDLIIQ